MDRKCRELDEIRIENLKFRCIIGVYHSERIRSQPVVLHLGLFLDTRTAGKNGWLEHTINYDGLVQELEFIMQHAGFGLLESAAEAISQYLLLGQGPRGHKKLIQCLALEIEKPAAMQGKATPSLKIRRDLRDANLEIGEPPSRLVFAWDSCRILVADLGPYQKWELVEKQGWELSAFTTEQGILVDDLPLAVSSASPWTALRSRKFVNQAPRGRRILIVERFKARQGFGQRGFNTMRVSQ